MSFCRSGRITDIFHGGQGEVSARVQPRAPLQPQGAAHWPSNMFEWFWMMSVGTIRMDYHRHRKLEQ